MRHGAFSNLPSIFNPKRDDILTKWRILDCHMTECRWEGGFITVALAARKRPLFAKKVANALSARKRRKRMLTIAKEDIEKKFSKYISPIDETGEDIVVASDNAPLIKPTSLTRKRSVADAFQDVRGKIKKLSAAGTLWRRKPKSGAKFNCGRRGE